MGLFSKAATEDDVNDLIWSIRELERDRPGGSDAMDRAPIARQFKKEKDLFELFADTGGFCMMIKEAVDRERLEPVVDEAISRSTSTNDDAPSRAINDLSRSLFFEGSVDRLTAIFNRLADDPATSGKELAAIIRELPFVAGRVAARLNIEVAS